MSCGTPFTVHFATTFTTLGFRKKKKIYNFLIRSLRHNHVKKKQNFVSALRLRHHDHEKNWLH